jgi:hypothetical protein
MTVNIELLGGPCDGELLVVEDDTRVWVVAQPRMSPSQLIALSEVLPSPELEWIPTLEHAYLASDRHNPRTGARLFSYAGVRQRS